MESEENKDLSDNKLEPTVDTTHVDTSETVEESDKPNSNGSVPVQPPSVVMGTTPAVNPSIATLSSKPAKAKTARFGKKKPSLLLGGVIAAVVLLGGSAAAYFGVVAPNQPSNIWKTSLDRTGKGYDKLVQYSQKQKNAKGTSINGSFKLEGQVASDGTFQVQSYNKDATFKFDAGIVASRVNVEGRAIHSENSDNPDLYVKVTGIKGLGALVGDQIGSVTDGLDGQWLSVDHTLLDNIENGALSGSQSSSSPSKLTLSSADTTKIYQTIGDVTKQYVLTTDSNKKVLNVAKSLGKEKQDDRTVYHYQVTIDKQHTKDYVNALLDGLQNTALSKFTTGGKKLRDEVDINSILKAIDGYKPTDTVDVYVDSSTKLIRTISIVDPNNKASHVDIGLHYTGGSSYPFVLGLFGKTGSGTIQLTLNTDTNNLDGNFNLTSAATDGSSKNEKISGKFTVKANNTAINAAKPDGATSLMEILGPIISGLGLGGSSSVPAGVSLPDGLQSL